MAYRLVVAVDVAHGVVVVVGVCEVSVSAEEEEVVAVVEEDDFREVPLRAS